MKAINAYNRFASLKFWGSGKRVSADCTKWNLYEQNLLSEYHIIERHFPDMLRVAISIKAGRRELGRVIRTLFLLRYINNLECVRRFTPRQTRANSSTGSCSG